MGTSHAEAIRRLADQIKADTSDWLHVSAREYSEAVPINFGAERIAQIEAQSGIPSSARTAAIDATRRQRHSLIPLDPSDWRRLFLRNGRVHSAPLPELHAMHPALRNQPRKKKASVRIVMVVPELQSDTMRFIEGALGQPGVNMGLVTCGSTDRLPEGWRDRLAGCAIVTNPRDAEQIVEAVRTLQPSLGKPERLLSPDDELQIPLAYAREKLGIEGPRAIEAREVRDGSRMRVKLEAAGLPIARYARIESVEDGLVFGTDMGYYPLVVKPNEGANAANTHRVETEDELRGLLEQLQATEQRPLICEEFIKGRECTLEVITIAGVPAWFSATRFEPEHLDVLLDPGTPLTISLPREQDDPADPLLRRMGFAALKALGIHTGMSSMRWHRRVDGTPIIANVTASPPAPAIISLMALAHGANMYRVWGNTVVNGLFAPIPRHYAAGAVYFRGLGQPQMASAVHGLDAVLCELGDIVVEEHLPEFVMVRHGETAVVDDALRRIAQGVRYSET
jgi:hypothetical protein